MEGTVFYKLTEQGRRASLLAGGDGKAQQTLKLTVTPEHLHLFDVDANGTVSATVHAPCRNIISDTWDTAEYDAPLDAVKALADLKRDREHEREKERKHTEENARIVAEEKAAREAAAKRKAEKQAIYDAVVSEFLRDPAGAENVFATREQPDGAKYNEKCIFVCNRAGTTHVFSGPEYAAAQKEAESRENAKRAATAEAERKRLEPLRQWGLAHGSPRLKALIEEGFAWLGIAHQEFVSAHTPDGYGMVDYTDQKVRLHPTLEEITELRRMRELCAKSNGVLSDPELCWNINTVTDDDGEETSYKFATVDVTINTPDGQGFVRSKRMSEPTE